MTREEVQRLRDRWDRGNKTGAYANWLEAEVERLRTERDEAIEHLRRLDSWGWGEGAPDDARRDWIEAREWLDERAFDEEDAK